MSGIICTSTYKAPIFTSFTKLLDNIKTLFGIKKLPLILAITYDDLSFIKDDYNPVCKDDLEK